MSYTPEALLKDGDRVLLTGKLWAEEGLEGERKVEMVQLVGLSPNLFPRVDGYWVLDPDGDWDWSVTRLGEQK